MASSSSSSIQQTETTSSVAMEQLQHFSHAHELSLVQLHPDHNNQNSDTENEDEDKDDIVVEYYHAKECKMCKEEIYSFHLSYYSCKDCDYSLHKFCAQLPTTLQNHPLHPDHSLTLSEGFQFHDPGSNYNVDLVDFKWICDICRVNRCRFYNYHCSICKFDMDIICATMSEQKMDHPCHPHQLERCFRPMMSHCNACINEHTGTFYHCTTCSCFIIHLNCALLPTKLLIQQSTNENFSHPHLLTLAYSFPYIEQRAIFFPFCRVCNEVFQFLLWHYRCNKCRYYVHVECATSKSDAFMSLLKPGGRGKTSKNFKDDDCPNLIRCPFPNEGFNLLKHHFINKGETLIKIEIDGEMFSHQHRLILFSTLNNRSATLYDPMKKVKHLCDGCVRPITEVPFYKCSLYHCNFVIHKWCARLPSQIQDHHDHPQHTLFFLPKIRGRLLGMFGCGVCLLPCNGFAYGCKKCEYYVDINCGFVPDIITHEAHPNHLLLRCKTLGDMLKRVCKGCRQITRDQLGYHCPACDFYIHTHCALLLPRTIRHRYDKHPLSLRYYPVENHVSEYFCDICEDEINSQTWFYHCNMCASFMHTACAPVKLQCEQSTFSKHTYPIFAFSNIKFGGRYSIGVHPHPVIFIQGINDDGQCNVCHEELQSLPILKCFQCKFASHFWCLGSNPAILDA